jgi:hypothetical protein
MRRLTTTQLIIEEYDALFNRWIGMKGMHEWMRMN